MTTAALFAPVELLLYENESGAGSTIIYDLPSSLMVLDENPPLKPECDRRNLVSPMGMSIKGETQKSSVRPRTVHWQIDNIFLFIAPVERHIGSERAGELRGSARGGNRSTPIGHFVRRRHSDIDKDWD